MSTSVISVDVSSGGTNILVNDTSVDAKCIYISIPYQPLNDRKDSAVINNKTYGNSIF
jgi:hypothetical protein